MKITKLFVFILFSHAVQSQAALTINGQLVGNGSSSADTHIVIGGPGQDAVGINATDGNQNGKPGAVDSSIKNDIYASICSSPFMKKYASICH